jgi:hypothetical protein
LLSATYIPGVLGYEGHVWIVRQRVAAIKPFSF